MVLRQLREGKGMTETTTGHSYVNIHSAQVEDRCLGTLAQSGNYKSGGTEC